MGDTALRDASGRFLPGSNHPGKITTTTQGHVLSRMRWDNRRDAFAAGILDTIRSTGLLPAGDDGDAGAWRVIGAKAAELLLDAEHPGHFASLLREVRQLVQDDAAGGDGITIHASQSALSAIDSILQAIAAAREEKAGRG